MEKRLVFGIELSAEFAAPKNPRRRPPTKDVWCLEIGGAHSVEGNDSWRAGGGFAFSIRPGGFYHSRIPLPIETEVPAPLYSSGWRISALRRDPEDGGGGHPPAHFLDSIMARNPLAPAAESSTRIFASAKEYLSAIRISINSPNPAPLVNAWSPRDLADISKKLSKIEASERTGPPWGSIEVVF